MADRSGCCQRHDTDTQGAASPIIELHHTSQILHLTLACGAPMFSFTRNPRSWLQTAIAVLLLGFALNTIAHAAHAHDPTNVFSQHGSCDHCVQFGHLAAGPQYAHEIPRSHACCLVTLPESDACDSNTTWLTASPRGPPSSEKR